MVKKEMKRARIFLVDDHPVFRDGLRSIIGEEADLLVCGEAADAPAARAFLSNDVADLVLLDLSLGRDSGMELLKDLLIVHPGLPILVVSMHEEAIYAERVLRAGARGYLTKAETSQSLLAAIRRVLAGKVFVRESVMTSIVTKMSRGEQPDELVERLSDRELQVFELIGQGLSSAEIAERMHVSIKSVQKYLARAKQKFGVVKLKDLLREAYRWQDRGNLDAT
jgi:DNA-binding NarL/FixJ family response regulator